MSAQFTSSRERFSDYRKDLKKRIREGQTETVKGPQDMRIPARLRHKRSRSFRTLFIRFWNMLGSHRWLLFGSLVTLSISTLLGLIPLYGSKLVFDSVLGGKPIPPEVPAWLHLPSEPRELLLVVALSMIGLSIAATLISNFSRWQATKVAKRIVVRSRRLAFEHAVRLPLHRVYELKSGGVASLLRDDAGGVGDLVFSMLYNPWRAIVQLTGSLFILTSVDWRLLVGGLAFLPTVWLTHRTWISRIRPVFRDIRSTRQGIDSRATESFGGMRVVRSFSRQRSEAESFVEGNHFMTRQEILSWWWSRGIDIAWAVIIPLASAVLLWFGGNRVLDDQIRAAAGEITVHQALTPGDLVMFLGYLGALLGPIATLASSATGFQNNLAGLDRTLDLLEEPIEMPDRAEAAWIDPANVQGHLSLKGVGFRYAGSETNVLEQVDLDVPAGSVVALVGPSGAGKTTLCNLVARFYDPTEGHIELDGVDLRDLALESYRQLLGIVEQDTFLFDGSIAENIAYGDRHATMEQVEQAARSANAHDFIKSMENGYDTFIGERGVKLSGGQRQRVTIARAILADPRILILDEATSNLDTESERLIQSSLLMLMRGRTSFVIAHRLSTIANADRIVVVENGRIAEQGSHAELMASSGRYRQMVELQTRPPEPPPPPHRRPRPAPHEGPPGTD